MGFVYGDKDIHCMIPQVISGGNLKILIIAAFVL